MDLKELSKVVKMLAEEKRIDEQKIIEVIEASLGAAYRKEYGHKGMAVKATLDADTGTVEFEQLKTVVDETTVRIVKEEEEGEEAAAEVTETEEGSLPRYNPDRHILIAEAHAIKKDAVLGEELSFPLEAPQEEFGRIAAQTAKQNILQRLREVERESITEEFKDKEENIISGVIRRFERGNVYVDLGRAEGVMFANEAIAGEHYRVGERLKFFVAAVQSDGRGSGVILSRRHPKFISKLFESEVPEISDGTVEIKAIAREAGGRTKVAVFSNDESVDAVGSFVGQRGTRVMAVNNEIGQEKLDIVEWSEDPELFVTNALSPAKVSRVEVGERREMRVFVPEDQLSLAIGRGGQNVRLAAKLTGMKIDVRSEANPEERIEGGVAEVVEVENEEQEKQA